MARPITGVGGKAMSEQANAVSGEKVTMMRPAGHVPSQPWAPEFTTCEHPETARQRIQRDYVETIAGLKRESLDQSYTYLTGLIDKAKEELGHARSATNELRRAALQQHIDELVAYCSGHGIAAQLPNRNGDALTQSLASFYVVEEIPGFLGEIKFLIDLWYDQGLAKVHDEMLALTGLAARLR
jgi:hypothetical protein